MVLIYELIVLSKYRPADLSDCSFQIIVSIYGASQEEILKEFPKVV